MGQAVSLSPSQLLKYVVLKDSRVGTLLFIVSGLVVAVQLLGEKVLQALDESQAEPNTLRENVHIFEDFFFCIFDLGLHLNVDWRHGFSLRSVNASVRDRIDLLPDRNR